MALFVSQGPRVPSSAITERKGCFPPFILSFIHLFTNKIFLGTNSAEDAKMLKFIGSRLQGVSKKLHRIWVFIYLFEQL